MTSASGLSATYDVENRLLTANAATYAYDGDGRRVTKTVGGTTTIYVYDAEGNLAAEYGGPVSSLCTTCYLVADALGSTRVVVGGTTGAPVRRYDYLPFGEALPVGIGGRTEAMKYQTSDTLALPDVVSQQFTGQQRDAEVGLGGLDFFEARYFSGAGGRFLSVDPENAGADSGNPQSWNGYSYALNNPFSYTDPTALSQEDGDALIGPFGFIWAGPPPKPKSEPSPPPPALSFWEEMFLKSLFTASGPTLQFAQQAQQAVQTVFDWLGSRDPACTMQAMARGGAAGMAFGGTVGLAGGPGGLVTLPVGGGLGFLGGAGIGGVGGLITCSSGTGSGSRGTDAGGKKQAKPKNAPPGTKPIDQMGWSSDKIHGIKRGLGAGPRDWVGVAPNGDVITSDAAGNAVNNGHWGTYLP